jgi:ABC-type nickel/cobalt efflux system permease component RcnA
MLVAVMGVYLFRLRRREQAVKGEQRGGGHQSAYLAPVQVVADGQLLTQPGWKVAAVETEDAPLVMGHSHGGRYHTHHVPEKVTLYSLITLGVSGGMVPCPDALVVLLSAIALNKIVLGLLILLAFSAGLASVLIAIGVVLVTAGKVVERYYPGQRLLDRVTLASYCVIVAMGLGIAYQSLASVGILRW